MSDEGPTKIHLDHLYCFGCKHHYRKMIRSGRPALYYYYCKHPSVLENHSDWYKEKGRYIGQEDETPGWCPIINPAKDNDK